MELTSENKERIDKMSYTQLLSHWRFASVGDPWFQGETGAYWSDKMAQLRNQPGGNERHVAASKSLGWR
jgi:hypothetical protein